MKSYKKSHELYDRATALIPGGVNSPVRAFKQVKGKPLYFKHAEGSNFTDEDGNVYTDYCLSWGPLILGHSHPEVVSAVRESANTGLSFGACHKGEIELAELTLSAFPDFNRIRFVNSGTEAVMTALRVARGVTGRDIIVKFEGGYHGHFDGMLVKAGSGLATHSIASSNGIPSSIAETTIVLPFDDEERVKKVFEDHGERIAAVIIEPLPANNGLLEQRKEFLQLLRDITTKNRSLLIFDEVISGFRFHFGGYWQLINIKPDIFTLGKIIGGGMPVGAIVSTSEILDILSPIGDVYQAGTLSGNPVSLAAGKATLNILKNEPPYKKLEKLGQHFTKIFEEGGNPFTGVVQIGSLLWLYFDNGEFPRSADQISPVAMERFSNIYWDILERGHYLPPSSYEVLFLSTAHTMEDVESLAGDIKELLKIKG